MNPSNGLPARRRDHEGGWHDLTPALCASCGCTYHFARDDPEVVWEPGAVRDAACGNRMCRCHTDPLMGFRR